MGLEPGGGAFKPQLTVQLNPALRTPGYYGRTVFFCPWGKKALTFSLNLTRLTRTPVDANNGHLFLAHRTDCFAVYFKVKKPSVGHHSMSISQHATAHRIWMNCSLLVIGQRFLSVSVDLVVGMTSL